MNTLEKAPEAEKEAFDKFAKTGENNSELCKLDLDQLVQLEENLKIKRANLSAELTNVERELKSISEAMFEKDKQNK